MMNHWRTENTNVFICLSAYIAYNVILRKKSHFILIIDQRFIPIVNRIYFAVRVLHNCIDHSDTVR